MRILRVILAVAVFLFFCVSSVVWADGGIKRYTVYDTKAKCQVVCKGQKPVLAVIEDGLAYALDIPLAILSPVTCPILTPVLEKIDPVQERSFKRTIRK